MDARTTGSIEAADKRPASWSAGRFVPLLVFVGLAVLFGVGLTLNPREVPSPLIGRPVPDFSLAPVKGRTLGLASENLRGEVSIVNVFASWCVECRAEHPLWMRLRADGLAPLHGLNYKDRPDDAAAWLAELGDPYLRIGADLDGRIGIEWGVYGVPETFVIDRRGVVRHKIIGAVNDKILAETLLPLVRRLQAEE
ncbi:MAG: DsbE family thiol:disulfide interchange protein [Betaproteobacteria bacterium]